MLGRGKRALWSPEIDALPDDEKAAAATAIYMLKVHAVSLKRARVSPIKKSLEFEALVARCAGPDIGLAEAQESRDLYEIWHCLRDAGTVLAGTSLTDGPYGDLFYRVTVGWSAVVGGLYLQRTGTSLDIDPLDTVPPPRLREFLNEGVRRFADGLAGDPSGTWERYPFTTTLRDLSSELGNTPDLIDALQNQPSLKSRLYPRDWRLGPDDIREMTGDDELVAWIWQATGDHS